MLPNAEDTSLEGPSTDTATCLFPRFIAIDETVANLIFDYVAVNPVHGKVWLGKYLGKHSLKNDRSNTILSRPLLYS
jgi:hypothetical protein